MTALSPLSEVERVLDEDSQSAWTRQLEAEKFALALPSTSHSIKRKDLVVAARVIGFFVLDFRKHNRNITFAERAHRKLVREAHSCWNSLDPEVDCLKRVIELGFRLQNYLTRVCMSRLLLSRDSF